ncbi:hypothetical protein ACFOHK_08895 [Falsigemmobacter intermedius]|nr:hypothetical protein [Falsigemmobacter intermedius]
MTWFDVIAPFVIFLIGMGVMLHGEWDTKRFEREMKDLHARKRTFPAE